MAKYELYQIRLTDEEVNKINTLGHNSVPKHVARLDMSFNDKIEVVAQEAYDNGYYTHVANIDAEDLNDVFRIGNLCIEAQIQRLERMHSPSVGDIIVDDLGHYYVISSFGFTLLTEASLAA